jgi:Transcriptional regulatory protein, C terminal
MNKRTNLKIGISALFICLVCGSFYAFLTPNTSAVTQPQLSERINLALRRTAHLLLKQAGDSTSTIAPIQQTGENTYLVRLNHAFNYDSLPSFLQNSFDFQEITTQYDVAVRDCTDLGLLILGYSSPDYIKNKEVACVGRDQIKGCLNFSVTFKDPSVKWANASYLWFILGGLFVLTILTMAYFFYKNAKKMEPIQEPMPSNDIQKAEEAHLIPIGKTLFDTRKQTLLIAEIEQKLTFQEAQLLQLFCEHRNELLERDFILKTVWGDDGVLITRSVDVFVSRLRKLLKPDESLKIVNVHNRGYRFETAD